MHSEASNATADSQPGIRGNGFESVAAQYRAMQEAQLLHEETINQLREEVRGQRERLAELARTNPSQKTGQLDIVMMRLTELERKIGEGAPDPLLNEIVHRLAALENAGPTRGAKDPRVEEVQARLEELRKSVEQAGGTDSRTDDLVLRIASLEGAFRRAAQSRDPEEVQARIEGLASELQQRHDSEIERLRASFSEVADSARQSASRAEDAASSAALEALGGRLAAVESTLADTSADERISDIGRQLAALEAKLNEGAAEELGSRVQSLEDRLAQDEANGVLDQVVNRVDALEDDLAKRTGDVQESLTQQIDALRERLNAVGTGANESETAYQLAGLMTSVRDLEARVAEPASGAAIADIDAKVARLEQALSSRPGAPEWARLETEINALRVEATQEPGLSHELTARIAELESRVSDAESAARLEDADARLGAIETKLQALGAPGEIGRRLTMLEMEESKAQDPRLDDALVRLAALESKPFESLSDHGLEDLKKRVAGLHGEIEKLSTDRLGALTELPERLARLEARTQEAQQAAPEDDGRQELLDSLQEQLQALSGRVEALTAPRPSASAQDPRVSELAARIEWIERNAGGESSADVDVEAIKRRLDVLEEKREAAGLSTGMQAELSARLFALEQGLESLQERGGAAPDVSAALKAETDRWNQWARSTMQEISDLREQVESGGERTRGGGGGVDAESLQALSVQLSTSLNTSEVKALRGQMYFVYLALGIIWALLMYALFT